MKYHRDNFRHLESEEMIKFKDEIVGDKTVTICSYMVSSPALWKLPMAKECRGIVWNSAGECICLPFEKFFNVNENDETQEHVLPFDAYYNVAEKRDGSMVSAVLINDIVRFKTKKSFYSDVAHNATEYAVTQPQLMRMCKYVLNLGYTPTFEFTSKSNEVVIDYGPEPQFVLLALRDMIFGNYLSPIEVSKVGKGWDIPTIKNYGHVPYEALKSEMAVKENFEGYVIEFQNGVRAKMKTEWYLRLHHAKTDLRERDVAEMFINETLDDIKSVCVTAGLSLEPIERIEMMVVQDIADLIENTKEIYGWIRLQESRKEAAIKFRDIAVFGLAMKLLDGKDPDYVKFWKTNYLKLYSLQNVYGNFNGVKPE